MIQWWWLRRQRKLRGKRKHATEKLYVSSPEDAHQVEASPPRLDTAPTANGRSAERIRTDRERRGWGKGISKGNTRRAKQRQPISLPADHHQQAELAPLRRNLRGGQRDAQSGASGSIKQYSRRQGPGHSLTGPLALPVLRSCTTGKAEKSMKA